METENSLCILHPTTGGQLYADGNRRTRDGTAKAAIVTRRYSIASKRATKTVYGRSGLPNGSLNVTFSAWNTCAPVALASELLPIANTPFPFLRLTYATENPRWDRAVLESRSPTRRIYTRGPDVVSCRKTTVQAGTELSRGDLWCFLFRRESIYTEIYKEICDINATISRKSLERSLCSDEFRNRPIQDFTISWTLYLDSLSEKKCFNWNIKKVIRIKCRYCDISVSVRNLFVSFQSAVDWRTMMIKTPRVTIYFYTQNE